MTALGGNLFLLSPGVWASTLWKLSAASGAGGEEETVGTRPLPLGGPSPSEGPGRVRKQGRRLGDALAWAVNS